MNKKLLLIPVGLIVAGILIAGAVVYTNGSCPEEVVENKISSEDAGNKLITFVNDNILAGQATASLVEVVEDGNLYKVSFNVEGQDVEWRISKDGESIYPEVIKIDEFSAPAQEQGVTVGNFSVSEEEVCLEDGKPVVYFFGSESCPHCEWEHPVVQEVMAKFEGHVSFKDNMDNQEDMDVFQRFSTGGVPTTVLGCKYYRVGSGQNQGEETETDNLTALTCMLTGGQPGEVCNEVQDVINQI